VLKQAKTPKREGFFRLFLAIGLLFVSLSLIACGETTPKVAEKTALRIPNTVALESKLLDRSAKAKRGSMAPDFSYTFADGTKQKLSDWRGKKVLLNFWATWCPPCKAEMPDIQAAAESLKREGLIVLAVNGSNEGVEEIAPFAQANTLTFPLIADLAGDLTEFYQVPGLPTSFFIDSNGIIYATKVGSVDFALIKQLLTEMK